MSAEEIAKVLRENMELKQQLRRLLNVTPVQCENCCFCRQWKETLYYCPAHNRYTEPGRYCSEGVSK